MARDEQSVGKGIAVLRMLVEKDLRPTLGSGINVSHPEALWLPILADRYVWDPDTVELSPRVPVGRSPTTRLRSRSLAARLRLAGPFAILSNPVS